MHCRLTRLSSIHQNLRTDKVAGDCLEVPAEGHPFTMTGKPLDPTKHVRLIETTPITRVLLPNDGQIIEFATKNSTYRWEHLTDPDSSAG